MADEVKFVDNPHAPDLYVSRCRGFFVDGPNVCLTLEKTRVNHVTSPGPVQQVVVARVVMSRDAALDMARFVFESLRNQEVPDPNAQGTPKVQ